MTRGHQTKAKTVRFYKPGSVPSHPNYRKNRNRLNRLYRRNGCGAASIYLCAELPRRFRGPPEGRREEPSLPSYLALLDSGFTTTTPLDAPSGVLIPHFSPLPRRKPPWRYRFCGTFHPPKLSSRGPGIIPGALALQARTFLPYGADAQIERTSLTGFGAPFLPFVWFCVV